MTDQPVDWRTITVHAGDWTCPAHGIITPAQDGPVPYCPGWVRDQRCQRIASHARLRGGKLQHVEPRPARCPAGHPLTPGTVLLSWWGCRCTPAGGHRTWSCQQCPPTTEPLQWPPHTTS